MSEKYVSQEKDPEYEKVLVDLIDDPNLTWVDKLLRAIEWQKQNRGLKGFHVSAYDEKATQENVARAILEIERKRARGELKETDVTKELL